MADKDILEEAKDAFKLASEREEENRDAALDDLRFARLAEQWDPKVKAQRDKDERPCLTINKLPAFIRQVVNDARQNKPSIKVHPVDSAADPATADVYNGLIRNIEATSKADVAYDTAVDFAVTMGFGYFRIGTRYAHDDNFDLDIVIDRIANPFSVFGDPSSTAADSSDWNSAFVTELMPRTLFQERYKGAEELDWEVCGYDGLEAPWTDGEKQIRVAEWWRREAVPRTILLLSDQTVIDAKEYARNKALFDAAGASVAGERQIRSHKVCQYLLTGAEQLEKNDWAGKYIPIIPVYGDEVNVEGKRYLKSLVRDAKDPQKMFNYWRTVSTELVALAPKAPFIGAAGSFKTDQAKWETANSETHAYIEYDPVGGAAPPQRQGFAGVPAGALQEALNASDDIKSIIGIYDAGLGARSNETSGRAIIARQREGDVSTFHFMDNLRRAIEHAGRVIIDLIPKVYTGERIIRVLGEDGTPATIPLKQPVAVKDETGGARAKIYDLAAGKYDLTVTSGPSFTTRREEAASQMIELLRAYPAVAPIIGDLVAKNLDWPGADEIARRLRAMLPAQIRGEGTDPAAQQAQEQFRAQAQQLQQALAATQAKLQKLEGDKQLEARKLAIDEFRAQTERMKAVTEAQQRALGAGVRNPAGF